MENISYRKHSDLMTDCTPTEFSEPAPQESPAPPSCECRHDSSGDDTPSTIIEAKSGWLAVDFHELWQYRELLGFLIWRDIKVRYKQTVLGAAWAVLQPVLSMLIFSAVFGRLAKLPSDHLPYPLFVFAALLPWTFFSNAVSQSGVSLVTQANMITKIYFPRIFVPIASIGVGVVDLGLSFLVFAVMLLYYMFLPGIAILLLPLLLLLCLMAAIGVGMFLAGITVIYRDFRHIIPFTVQIWMYASPVVYPLSMVPTKYRWIVAFNPMAGIIDGFRSSLLGSPVDWLCLGISSAVTVAIFLFGLYYFRRMERRFADIV
jgi:lipopolysaccharide transport system permease protein